MTPYLLLWGSAALPALTGRKGRALILVGLLYFVMIGWRFHVGMDWNNYTAILERDGNKDLSTLMSGAEAGFGLLVWIAGSFGGLTFLNAVSAGFFCLGLFAVARRLREPLLAITYATPYLVIVVAMSATRQTMALGLVFFLFARWDRFGTLARSAIILLASLFHFSAIAMMVFVVLGSHLSGFRRALTAAIVGGLVIGIILYAPDRVAFYNESYVSGSRVVESSGAVSHVLLLAIPAAIYFALRRIWLRIFGLNPLMEQLAAASILALPGLALSSTAVDRLSLYFWPAAMYVIAGLPSLQRHAETRVAVRVSICLVALGLIWFWLSFANSRIAYLPYRNLLIGA